MQDYVHLVHLVKYFPTNIQLKNRRRYNRERASPSLHVISNHLIIQKIRNYFQSFIHSPPYSRVTLEDGFTGCTLERRNAAGR